MEESCILFLNLLSSWRQQYDAPSLPKWNQLSRHSLYLMCFSLHSDFSEFCWTCLSATLSPSKPQTGDSPWDTLSLSQEASPSSLSLLAALLLVQQRFAAFPGTSTQDWLRLDLSLASSFHRSASSAVCNPRCRTLYWTSWDSCCPGLSKPRQPWMAGLALLDTVSPMNWVQEHSLPHPAE